MHFQLDTIVIYYSCIFTVSNGKAMLVTRTLYLLKMDRQLFCVTSHSKDTFLKQYGNISDENNRLTSMPKLHQQL